MPVTTERRSGLERRRHSLGAYWRGALNPRRRNGRRRADTIYPIIDWHSPRVFLWVIAILSLCTADAALTVTLLSHGAVELNPVMAKFLPHSPGTFTAVKLALTGIGIIVLAACSRMKLFRALRGEAMLMLVLVAYALLVAYELRLLERGY